MDLTWPARKKAATAGTTAQRLRAWSRLPRHHAQGQGSQRRRRPPADAHLDHVPQVPRRHGADPRARRPLSRASASGLPSTPPYRWRDWAANRADDGGLHNAMTGDALIAFINQDEPMRPDGERGAGLFAYLRALQRGRRPRRRRRLGIPRHRQPHESMATSSATSSTRSTRSTSPRPRDPHPGPALRVDAPGDARRGRRFRRVLHAAAARQIDRRGLSIPSLGETVLDPAAGTGGFLVEAYEHLRPHATTVEDCERLQRRTLFGIEAKPLPYLLVPDEPAPARPGVAAHRSRAMLCAFR